MPNPTNTNDSADLVHATKEEDTLKKQMEAMKIEETMEIGMDTQEKNRH